MRLLEGRWLFIDGLLNADETCVEIERLIAGPLRLTAVRQTGWAKLYVDPIEGTAWELTYPEGFNPGIGPPCLRELTAAEARELYQGEKRV